MGLIFLPLSLARASLISFSSDFKKEKKYSVRTFHTYLARCSLSIDSEAFGFFSPEKNIFFSDLFFVLDFFDSFRENRKLLEAPASASVMEFTASFGRACACACACARIRILAPITFGS